MADRDIYPKWTFRCSRAHVHQFRLDMYINRPRVDFLSHVNFLSPGTDRWTASFSAPPQCSPGHLGVVINIVIIIILIAIISFINLCRWTAGFLVWTSMLGTMVVLTYVTK